MEWPSRLRSAVEPQWCPGHMAVAGDHRRPCRCFHRGPFFRNCNAGHVVAAPLTGAYPGPPMANPDLALLRLMRTRGHSPARRARRKGDRGERRVRGDLGRGGAGRRRLRSSAPPPLARRRGTGPGGDRAQLRGQAGGSPPPPAARRPAAPGRRPELAVASLRPRHRLVRRRDRDVADRAPPRPGALRGRRPDGLTRPYLGMHYPSDVVAGAALGTALGKLVPGLDDRHRGPAAEQMPADS